MITVKELYDELHRRWTPDGNGGFLLAVPKKGQNMGDPVGFDHNMGYRETSIFNVRYMMHTLTYLYYTGEYHPYIDHIDGNGCNNSMKNLRPATHQKNMCNQKKRTDNVSGYKGVYFNNNWQTYEAYVSVDKKKYSVFRITDIVQAARIRDILAICLHGDFVRLDIPEYRSYYDQVVQYYQLSRLSSSDMLRKVRQIKNSL